MTTRDPEKNTVSVYRCWSLRIAKSGTSSTRTHSRREDAADQSIVHRKGGWDHVEGSIKKRCLKTYLRMELYELRMGIEVFLLRYEVSNAKDRKMGTEPPVS